MEGDGYKEGDIVYLVTLPQEYQEEVQFQSSGKS
jgi:hypothetical protein